MINAFNFFSYDTYNMKQQKRKINAKKKTSSHRWLSFNISSHLVMTCCFKQAFLILVITFFGNEKRRESRHLGLTKSEGIRKRFDYIPNRIESARFDYILNRKESAENLNTDT